MFGFLRDFIDLLSFLNFLKKEDQKITLDELANMMSDHTDQIIIDLMRKELLNFGGGFFEIFYDDNKPNNFDINLKLYFSDENGGLFLKETGKKLAIGCLYDVDSIELKNKKNIKYVVNIPVNQ